MVRPFEAIVVRLHWVSHANYTPPGCKGVPAGRHAVAEVLLLILPLSKTVSSTLSTSSVVAPALEAAVR